MARSNAPHFGRPSSTHGKSSEKIESQLRGREEANRQSAEGMMKYMVKKKIKEKNKNEEWKKQSEGNAADIYNDI